MCFVKGPLLQEASSCTLQGHVVYTGRPHVLTRTLFVHTSLCIFYYVTRTKFTVAQALSSSSRYNRSSKSIYIQENDNQVEVSFWVHVQWDRTKTVHHLHTTPALPPPPARVNTPLPPCCHSVLNKCPWEPCPHSSLFYFYFILLFFSWFSLSLWWELRPKEQGLNLVCSALSTVLGN